MSQTRVDFMSVIISLHFTSLRLSFPSYLEMKSEFLKVFNKISIKFYQIATKII